MCLKNEMTEMILTLTHFIFFPMPRWMVTNGVWTAAGQFKVASVVAQNMNEQSGVVLFQTGEQEMYLSPDL